jgi:hypothetical protein
MLFGIAVALTVILLGYVLFVRDKDIPEPVPVSPYHHLETRKAAIYENLRDLQFEFRVGKLSETDYQRTKQGLQSELAAVLAEIDAVKGAAPEPVAKAAAAKPGNAAANVAKSGAKCPSCGAKFDRSLKFCGECGKPMEVRA